MSEVKRSKQSRAGEGWLFSENSSVWAHFYNSWPVVGSFQLEVDRNLSLVPFRQTSIKKKSWNAENFRAINDCLFNSYVLDLLCVMQVPCATDKKIVSLIACEIAAMLIRHIQVFMIWIMLTLVQEQNRFLRSFSAIYHVYASEPLSSFCIYTRFLYNRCKYICWLISLTDIKWLEGWKFG